MDTPDAPVLEANDGGCAAVFAPGRWHHARVADDPPGGEQGES